MATTPDPFYLLTDLNVWTAENPTLKDQTQALYSTLSQIAITESESEHNWNYLNKILLYLDNLKKNNQLSPEHETMIHEALKASLEKAAQTHSQY